MKPEVKTIPIKAPINAPKFTEDFYNSPIIINIEEFPKSPI